MKVKDLTKQKEAKIALAEKYAFEATTLIFARLGKKDINVESLQAFCIRTYYSILENMANTGVCQITNVLGSNVDMNKMLKDSFIEKDATKVIPNFYMDINIKNETFKCNENFIRGGKVTEKDVMIDYADNNGDLCHFSSFSADNIDFVNKCLGTKYYEPEKEDKFADDLER